MPHPRTKRQEAVARKRPTHAQLEAQEHFKAMVQRAHALRARHKNWTWQDAMRAAAAYH